MRQEGIKICLLSNAPNVKKNRFPTRPRRASTAATPYNQRSLKIRYKRQLKLKSSTGYLVYNKNDYKYVVFFDDLESAMIDVLKNNPGHTISEKHEIKEAPVAVGKYSCPSCKAKFTNSWKKSGAQF